MHYIIDGRLMVDKVSAHTYLKETLSFPEYYGNNLDALYDVLTERHSPVLITIEHTDELKTLLSEYGAALLETFSDAAENNPNLTVIFA